MERCSISGPTPLWYLLLVAVVTCPTCCQEGAEHMQLSVTAQATPTPLWAVDWGPTQPLEDETHHLLSSQETEGAKAATPEAWPHHWNTPTNQTQQQPLSIEARDSGEEPEEEAQEKEPEEVMTALSPSVLLLSRSPSLALWLRRTAGRHFTAPPPSPTERGFLWSTSEELTALSRARVCPCPCVPAGRGGNPERTNA
ncbi:PILR alpha-associated neural protein isoform X1 [Astyanax mexicanus]|uniref:PILR alpha-associated neural protein isoform X1 n=1 Tax=Astyanax mexicanus TaxID=7994 RepID=UPI0020CAAE97|nr:PILR alpha-associated neural protein isoform X1 [Astyanax mexicanus]